MTLAASTRLGPYEVSMPLGAGGMGEVYRARDTRLGRDVAIKVLPASVMGDSDRLRRFEQEARAAGVLNHPNILAIYDVGTHDGAPYVVSELLEGETLRERLSGAALPLRKVIDFALQIARGLAAAHEKGIVHRDLKPENVFVTKDGRVKILDFGLAKLVSATAVGSGPGTAATLRFQSDPSMIMGTAGYMSPEQVRGLPVDHRSDIFSFGAVLYEMITGKRAFRGESAVETMNAILKEDPPELGVSRGNIPLALARVLHHCLEKKPEERFQSSCDLAFALEALSGLSEQDAVPAPAARARFGARVLDRRVLVPLLALALIGSHVGAYYVGVRRAERPLPSFQRLTFRRGAVSSARFAPDGRTIVYSAAWEGSPNELYMTRPESPESRPLDLGQAKILAISSAGEMAVALHRDRGWVLARVPLGGGAPREILEDVQDADWSPDGSKLAVLRYVEGRNRLEYPIGTVVQETSGPISYPRVSPKGDMIAFLERETKSSPNQSVAVVDLDGKKTAISGAWLEARGLAWTPGGELWFTASEIGGASTVHAVTPSGGHRVVTRLDGSVTLLDISREGRVLTSRTATLTGVSGLVAGEAKERDLSWLDGSIAVDVSRDGQTVLLSEEGQGGGPNRSVYLRKTDGSPAVRLGDGRAQALSPDGRWAISILPSSPPQLVLLPTGVGEQRVLPAGGIGDYKYAWWLPDGRRVLFLGREADRGWRCYVQDVDGGAPRPLTPEGTYAYGSVISPDGSWVGAADEAARFALYSTQGGEPRPVPGLMDEDMPVGWSPDGRSMFVYRAEGATVKIYRLDLSTERRELVREIVPADATGNAMIVNVLLTPDAKSYIYTYRRSLSNLSLIDGLG